MSLMEDFPEDMPEANDDPDVEGHTGGLPEDMPEAHDEEPDVEGHIGGLPENLPEDRIK